ncbi:hypothetical protein NP233_g1022 [Leucocoprinus birnbaumii]|uniref:Uncharacterized protein n=1 Tax=Leucocoprinus birnbaumii TaxID=56174 RepID=A0AAD5W635_9AGAR|nr:hypothetical protein NP233_g1022 [Leucocoprinus birnbaumii]
MRFSVFTLTIVAFLLSQVSAEESSKVKHCNAKKVRNPGVFFNILTFQKSDHRALGFDYFTIALSSRISLLRPLIKGIGGTCYKGETGICPL